MAACSPSSTACSVTSPWALLDSHPTRSPTMILCQRKYEERTKSDGVLTLLLIQMELSSRPNQCNRLFPLLLEDQELVPHVSKSSGLLWLPLLRQEDQRWYLTICSGTMAKEAVTSQTSWVEKEATSAASALSSSLSTKVSTTASDSDSGTNGAGAHSVPLPQLLLVQSLLNLRRPRYRFLEAW